MDYKPIKWYTWRDKLRCFLHGHQWKEYADAQFTEIKGRTCFNCGKKQEVVKTFKTIK